MAPGSYRSLTQDQTGVAAPSQKGSRRTHAMPATKPADGASPFAEAPSQRNSRRTHVTPATKPADGAMAEPAASNVAAVSLRQQFMTGILPDRQDARRDQWLRAHTVH